MNMKLKKVESLQFATTNSLIKLFNLPHKYLQELSNIGNWHQNDQTFIFEYYLSNQIIYHHMLESLPPPNELTHQFIRLLHESQGNHTGYFQIVEFHQKRQKYYSTHISDGYFKCKVIFKDKASKQIDKGQIKLFSILHGVISNQGNRILMVFNQLKSWDYPRTVGVIRSWRFQSTNNYLNGSNFISWFSDQNQPKQPAQIHEDSDNETVSAPSYCASEVHARKNSHDSSSSMKLKQKLSTNSLQSHAFSFGVNNQLSNQTIYHGSTQSINLPIRNQIQSKAKSDQINLIKNEPDDKVKKLLIVAESQSQNNFSHTKSNENNPQTNLKQKETFKDRFSRVSQAPSFKEESKQKINDYPDSVKQDDFNTKNSHEHERNEEEQDMFEEMKAEMSKIRQRKLQEFLEQPIKDQSRITNKSRLISNSRTIQNQQSECKSVSRSRRKSVFDLLMSPDEEGSRSYSNIKSKMSNTKLSNIKLTPTKPISKFKQDLTYFSQIGSQPEQKIKFCYKKGDQLNFTELSASKDAANRNKKWMAVLIICIKSIQQGNNTKLVVIAQQQKKGGKYGYIFNIVLSNADVYCPFQEGQVYQVSLLGFTVTEPLTEQMFVSIELRNNAQDVLARKIEEKRDEILEDEPHFCYVALSKIQDMKEGISLNVVGLVYNYKNISNKKKNGGWTNIFTIIDPFTGSSVSFTIFDSCKLIYEPGSPVVVFNGITKIYQGKVTLCVRNYTLYYFGKEIVYGKFCRFIPQVEKMRVWQEQGNTVGNIVELKQKYRQIKSLFQVELANSTPDEENLNVETPICRVTQISPFFFRLLCDSCNKKLNKNGQNCFNCGRRQNPVKQLQLSMQVSDNSHSVYVEFNHYDSMNLIGEQGQKLVGFVDSIMHKRVKFWLRLNPKYKPMVVKMQVLQESILIRKQMLQLKQLVKFL